VTGMIRTSGPVITFNGAWAQNIGEEEMFIDFMGDKACIRLHYGRGLSGCTPGNSAPGGAFFEGQRLDFIGIKVANGIAVHGRSLCY